ncbi:MAG: sodium:solute symporter family protein [Synergistaceae bacterium]|nr:sodium:solute symporter family protein [Synergistaceae bacterium]
MLNLNGYILFILGYAIFLLIIGAWAGRKVKSAEGFFVAGRKLGSGLLFTTLIAANLGAGSTVGVTALAYTHGISAWWWIGSAGVGSIILAFWVGPKIWRIAREQNFLTLSDYLDWRYSAAFRGLLSVMMSIGTLALFSGQLLGVAWILEVVAGVPKQAGIIVGALVTTLYFAAGGLMSAAFVNIFEVAIILAGFIIALPFIWSYTGGWSEIVSRAFANGAGNNYFEIDGMGLTAITGYLVMLVPSFFISPGLIGKVFGAKDEHSIKVGTALNGLVQLVFAVVPVFIGAAAFAFIPGLTRADLALPSAMKTMMPFPVAALALAAIFAAEVSTADTVLYMLAGSLTNDLYKRFINPNISDKKLLLSSRLTSLICGVLGVLLALELESIISALTIFYSLMSVSLAAPLIFGLFTKRASNTGALLSAGLGIALTLFCTFYNATPSVNLGIGVLDTATHLVDFGFAKFNASTCGILFSFIIMALATLFIPDKK